MTIHEKKPNQRFSFILPHMMSPCYLYFSICMALRKMQWKQGGSIAKSTNSILDWRHTNWAKVGLLKNPHFPRVMSVHVMILHNAATQPIFWLLLPFTASSPSSPFHRFKVPPTDTDTHYIPAHLPYSARLSKHQKLADSRGSDGSTSSELNQLASQLAFLQWGCAACAGLLGSRGSTQTSKQADTHSAASRSEPERNELDLQWMGCDAKELPGQGCHIV